MKARSGVSLSEERHALRVSLTLAVFLTLAGSARAQDDLNDDVIEAPVAVENQFMIAEENFNMWVFGNSRDATTARNRLEVLFNLQIEELARVVRLTPAQKKKLELAGRGDMKRFFDLVEEKRRGFQLVKHDQNKFNAFYQELRPLQLKLNSGLYGQESFYAKTLKRTLDADQSEAFARVARERELYRYRAQISQVVATLDNSVGLRAEQRRNLLKIVFEETRPPSKHSQYDSYVVLYQLSKFPEERLKTLFNATQWPKFKHQLENAQRLEKFLITQGVLPEDFPGGPKAFAGEPNK